MFYKIRNFLTVALSFAFVLASAGAKAQGLVSLSEEAMFDDGLESGGESTAGSTQDSAKDAPAAPTVAPTATTNAAAEASQPASPAATTPSQETSTQDNIFSLPPSDKGGVGLFGSVEEPENISDDVFSQMSDLEKRTALLNLELRREKLQNEIEAVKNARRQAVIEEEQKAEAQRLKNLEIEKEQERKVIEEKAKLRELDIMFEKLRQEKVLMAYKNQMLEENQKWIEHDAAFYKQIADLRDSKKALTENMKKKMLELQEEAQKAQTLHRVTVGGYKKTVQDMQAQMGVLRSRIETLEKEKEEASRNPFAGAAGQTAEGTVSADGTAAGGNGGTSEPIETDLSKLYAVTEIRGQGNELIAKLINKSGTAFYVKKGTALQTGHIIDEITSAYVLADKNGDKKYLYLAAGGVLPIETPKFEVTKEDGVDSPSKKSGK